MTVSSRKPMTESRGPVIPTSLVRGALGQDLGVRRRDVGVGAHHGGDPTVEVPAHGVLLGGDLAVEVHEAEGGNDSPTPSSRVSASTNGESSWFM